MKIGDKVRFLNEVGGGIVTSFVGKNLVNVEDENGFDIPVPIQEVVVIETDDYNIDVTKRHVLKENGSDATEVKKPAVLKREAAKDEEMEPADLPITFKPLPTERTEGERLNIFLCFVPVNLTSIADTDFEVYLVNDSNFFADYVYMSGSNDVWNVRFRGTLEPNTKMYIETISRLELNDLECLCFQFLFYKQGKTFLLKPAMTVKLRLDLTKFYKVHTFTSNSFFTEKVQTIDVVRNDKPAKEIFIAAEEVQKALEEKRNVDKSKERVLLKAVAIKKESKEDILVVDLHDYAVLDTTNGMKPHDILEYQLNVFRKTMNDNITQKGKKLVFIHGKGNGILRNAVLRELKKYYGSCVSQDASFLEYGYGATMVIIH